MMYAECSTNYISHLQPERPIRILALSFNEAKEHSSYVRKALICIQVILYATILAILSFQFGLSLPNDKSTLFVTAQVAEGAALFVIPDDTKGSAGQLQKRLTQHESILLKSGDRIKVVEGVVLLTNVDGSTQQISNQTYTVSVPEETGYTPTLSLQEWFMRIVMGLTEPFTPNVTVASVLG